MTDRGRKLFSVGEAIEAFFTDQDSDNDNLIVDQMLNIVLVVKMSQLMKKMIWEKTALFYLLQTLVRMVKQIQMTKKVIVLPLESCRNFFVLDLESKKHISNMFILYVYIVLQANMSQILTYNLLGLHLP